MRGVGGGCLSRAPRRSQQRSGAPAVVGVDPLPRCTRQTTGRVSPTAYGFGPLESTTPGQPTGYLTVKRPSTWPCQVAIGSASRAQPRAWPGAQGRSSPSARPRAQPTASTAATFVVRVHPGGVDQAEDCPEGLVGRHRHPDSLCRRPKHPAIRPGRTRACSRSEPRRAVGQDGFSMSLRPVISAHAHGCRTVSASRSNEMATVHKEAHRPGTLLAVPAERQLRLGARAGGPVRSRAPASRHERRFLWTPQPPLRRAPRFT